jgi:hypothetical protein
VVDLGLSKRKSEKQLRLELDALIAGTHLDLIVDHRHDSGGESPDDAIFPRENRDGFGSGVAGWRRAEAPRPRVSSSFPDAGVGTCLGAEEGPGGEAWGLAWRSGRSRG